MPARITKRHQRRMSPTNRAMLTGIMLWGGTTASVVFALGLALYPAWLLGGTLATFAMFGFDKLQAKRDTRRSGRGRVPERALLLLSFIGGAFGGLAGMIIFRHKIRTTAFVVAVPLFVLLHVGVAWWLLIGRYGN